jgi:SAM-dependent methyltransferase
VGRLNALIGKRRRLRYVNLTRAPYSDQFGWDRGRPVDRLYIEDWVGQHRDLIHGRVLELQDTKYISRYGTDVEPVVLDLDDPAADITGDLCDPRLLEGWRFDAEIVTQALQYMPDPMAAVRNLFRALAPGGTLLLTVPLNARLDGVHERWRWTPLGFSELLACCCPEAQIAVEGFGNSAAAAGALLGLSISNIGVARLRRHDPAFPIVVCAAVRAPA